MSHPRDAWSIKFADQRGDLATSPAAPMGLALMLGHSWNRLRLTTIYEDIATEQLYEGAFHVTARKWD